MQPRFVLAGTTHRAEPVREEGSTTVLAIDGVEVRAALAPREPGPAVLSVDGVQRPVWTAQDGGRIFVRLDGRTWELTADDVLEAAAAGAGTGGGEIRAPMPGAVLALDVAPGAEVRDGDRLMLIESMKLQTEIRAPVDGTVVTLAYAVGESFDKGAVLLRLEPAGEPESTP